MNLSFQDKVALVPGASSGMGLATDKAFAGTGDAAVLAYGRGNAVRNESEKVVAGHEYAACGVRVNAVCLCGPERAMSPAIRWSSTAHDGGVTLAQTRIGNP